MIMIYFVFCLGEMFDKSAPPPSQARAAMYAVPQQGPAGEIIYPPANPVILPAFGAQVIATPNFGRTPVQCTCPRCRSIIVTRTEESVGVLAWLICFILVLVGCWLGCCLIPFCISDIQNIQHYCPNCNALLGEYRPLWDIKTFFDKTYSSLLIIDIFTLSDWQISNKNFSFSI